MQSSLRRQFGLDTDDRAVKPKERGIAQMMADLSRSWADPLDNDTLFRWHRMLLADSRHLEAIGGYRRHEDAMQIVSGRYDRPRMHFEAPPSSQIPEEMTAFLAWFNGSAPNGGTPLPALTRAGIGHLYFESIHPFEDGNGRIGRAVAEKSLAQNIGQPTLIALAHTIEQHRMAYYEQLEFHQRTLDITGWLTDWKQFYARSLNGLTRFQPMETGRPRYSSCRAIPTWQRRSCAFCSLMVLIQQ